MKSASEGKSALLGEKDRKSGISAKQGVLFVFGKDVLEEGFAFGNILGHSWQNLIENWMTEELQHNIHRRCLA